MYFSTLSLTARGFNPSSNSNICMKSCSFILHHTRHLQKMQIWAVILGVALWKIFRNEAPVSLGGGSWNPYQSTAIQHPWRFCFLSFFKQATRPFCSLLLPCSGGVPTVSSFVWCVPCLLHVCWQYWHFPICQELLVHQEGLSSFRLLGIHRLRWRQPKEGLLFPFFHIFAPVEIQCSMLQWRHLLLDRAKQSSWVPTYSVLQHVFLCPQRKFFSLPLSASFLCPVRTAFLVHYFPSRDTMFLDKGGDCFISLTGKRLGHFELLLMPKKVAVGYSTKQLLLLNLELVIWVTRLF